MSFRQRLWLANLVGDTQTVAEARQLDIDKLVNTSLHYSDNAVLQIDLDITRSGLLDIDLQKSLRRVLLAWCALNDFGYVQGMNLVGAALLRSTTNGRYPEHDTLACMSGVMKLNAGLLPFHMEDDEPMKLAGIVVSKMWVQICGVEPSLEDPLRSILDLFEIACLRIMSVCFVTFFNLEALYVIWDYVFKDMHRVDIETSARCRHVFSAAVLSQKRLWLLGEDPKQNFVIFEATCALLDKEQAAKIVDVAKYLERLEIYN